MLPPDYFTGKEERLLAIYRKWEEFVMKDIARRLLAAGKMTGTADRLIWKMEQVGMHREAIIKKLSALTGMTTKELKKLLQDAVLTSWEDEAATLAQIGMALSKPLENPRVIEVMDAEYKKSLAELENLTRTTMNKTQQDLINLLDEAEVRVSAGTQSYNAAACQALDEYAGKGIKVQYPTGAELTLEAAVRLCVVTSMNQTAAQITNQYVVETGSNYVLFSAHPGARTAREGQPVYAGHDTWQGRVFSIRGSEPGYPNLLESTGYDIDPATGQGKVVDPLGAHGYNCRHSHKVWDKRLKNPWRDADANLILGDGSILSAEENEKRYKLQQKQRAMERAIRKTKREIVIKQQEMNGIAETDVRSILQEDYDKLAAKLTQQNKAYNDFCKDNDLQPDYVRAKVADFGRKQQAQVNASVKAYKNAHLQENNVANSLDTDIIRTGSAKEENAMTEMRHLGKINTEILGKEFGKIQTDEIIVTNERIAHIKERHPEDYALFEKYGKESVIHPDLIIKDIKHDGTVFMVKRLPETNLNVVVRVALETDDSKLKNSIMTFYRIRERNLCKLIEKNGLLYRKE